jgi:hypothetical protein
MGIYFIEDIFIIGGIFKGISDGIFKHVGMVKGAARASSRRPRCP